MRFTLWRFPAFRILLGVLYGLLWTAAGSVLLAGLLLLGNVPERMLSLAADALWGLGSFMAGNRAGTHGRLHGIRTGFCCGLLMCGILLGGCIVMDNAVSTYLWGRCGILLLAGICGGIRGVNTKITKPPY